MVRRDSDLAGPDRVAVDNFRSSLVMAARLIEKPVREFHRVAVCTAGTFERASGDGVPSGVSPFDAGFVAHLLTPMLRVEGVARCTRGRSRRRGLGERCQRPSARILSAATER